MPPDPQATAFVQQVPLMDGAEELFPLRSVEGARQLDQHARVPEAQQGAAVIGKVHVQPQLQQLRQALQVLRGDQPDERRRLALERAEFGKSIASSAQAASTSQGPA